MSLFDSLLWGHELKRVSCDSSPSSPRSPMQQISEPMVRPPSWFWSERQDAYGWRAQAALDAICAIPAPEGLIVWLDENSPSLYRKLMRDLPKRISRSWNDRIPAEAFDALCLDLVNTYERAAELFSRTTQSRNLFDRRGSTEG